MPSRPGNGAAMGLSHACWPVPPAACPGLRLAMLLIPARPRPDPLLTLWFLSSWPCPGKRLAPPHHTHTQLPSLSFGLCPLTAVRSCCVSFLTCPSLAGPNTYSQRPFFLSPPPFSPPKMASCLCSRGLYFDVPALPLPGLCSSPQIPSLPSFSFKSSLNSS